MKQFLLVLLVILWPATARATLFTYDISVLFLAEYLADPRFGNVQVGVFFPQETSLHYPYGSFQLPNAGVVFSINGDLHGAGEFWGLNEISLTDYRISADDAGGRVSFDLLYDAVQSANAPFREPDRLLVNFGAEMGPGGDWCNTATTGPCPIGTGGTHTFEQGEFSFASSHEIAEPAALVLLVCGLLLIGLLKFRYSHSSLLPLEKFVPADFLRIAGI